MLQEINEKILSAARRVRLLLLDVDGVMTDGAIFYGEDGKETKVFHVRDGHGIKLLQQRGIRVGIITGRSSEAVKKRARELDITDLFQGCHDKTAAYEQIKSTHQLQDHEIAYIGDDIVDIPLLKRVGFSVAPSDAVEEVKNLVMYVTSVSGGRGVVREVAEVILKAKGLWKGIIDEYNKV